MHEAWHRLPDNPPWIFAHRGARHAAPENTMAAFELALEEGADGIEFDVRLSADGVPVVLHDRRLNRVTSGADRREVAALSLRQLQAVDVGAGERPPRLSDVLDWARGRPLRLNIELKQDVSDRARLVRSVAELLRLEPDASLRIVLSSFHPLIVQSLARTLPKLPVAWLVHSRQALLRYAPCFRLLGASGVHPEANLVTRARVLRFKRAGAFVNTWTVNDPKAAQQVAEAGVDAIITDSPGALRSGLGL